MTAEGFQVDLLGKNIPLHLTRTELRGKDFKSAGLINTLARAGEVCVQVHIVRHSKGNWN